MIITQVTVKGHEHWLYLKRQENPLRVVVERSVHTHGPYRMMVGTIHLTDNLEALYTLMAPLLYGASPAELTNPRRADLENLVRQLLR